MQPRHSILLLSVLVDDPRLVVSLALDTRLSADSRQQIEPPDAKMFVEEFMDIGIVGVAKRIAIVRSDLAEPVEIQLANEARDVARLEDGARGVEVLLLELLVVEEDRRAGDAPPDRPGSALVHDPPQFLGKTQRGYHAVVVHREAKISTFLPGDASEALDEISNKSESRDGTPLDSADRSVSDAFYDYEPREIWFFFTGGFKNTLFFSSKCYDGLYISCRAVIMNITALL